MTTRENRPAKRGRSSRVNRELGASLGVPLTRREREVIRALLAGHATIKDLARRLQISPKTATGHLYRIYLKSGAYNMADLVLMALGRKTSAVDLEVDRDTG